MILSNVLSRRNRILLRELVVTEFKLRYQDSILGFLWSLLKPLLMFTILYFVFGKLLKIGSSVEHYAVYLLLGIVLWNFFTEATSQGLNAIVARGDLIRKINFPKYIIVVSGTVSALINLGFNMIIIVVFMVINGVPLLATAPIFLISVIELYIFALAIAFFLAAANVKFRDMGHIWEIIMQAAFYATPILYPVSLLIGVAGAFGKLLMLNPVAQIIQDARYSLITHQSDTVWSIFAQKPYIAFIPIVAVLISAVVASVYFKRSSKYFAENV
ncbi:MAG: ABC transporter permease [Patescibacteria group bacterium]